MEVKMKEQEIKFMTLPVPQDFHKKFKTLASFRGKTFKALFLELANEYFQKPENQKILDAWDN